MIEIEKEEHHHKVHRRLVIGGVIVGILIFIGLAWQIELLISLRGLETGGGQSQGFGQGNEAPEQGGQGAGPTTCATNCLSISDNGKSLTMTVMSQVTISLPTGTYNESTLVITANPSDMLGEVFGAYQPTAGEWTRTFEAVKAGTADITVSASSLSGPNFDIHITAQ